MIMNLSFKKKALPKKYNTFCTIKKKKIIVYSGFVHTFDEFTYVTFSPPAVKPRIVQFFKT